MHVTMIARIHASAFCGSSKTLPSVDRSKGNLSVNVGEDLLDRINRVAEAVKKSQAEFVRDALDKITEVHQREVDEITKQQKIIAEREKKLVISVKR